MKIKLTESQYNKLLLENDKDFLDGKVKFPNIGNKVNKFIVTGALLISSYTLFIISISSGVVSITNAGSSI